MNEKISDELKTVQNDEETNKKNVIIAVHPDDEILGNFEIIDNPENPPVILYVGDPIQKRREEAMKLREHMGITIQIFCNSVPQVFLNPSNTLYFPDPTSELNPMHRLYGSQGENYLRQGLDVVFYTTNMNVAYIHETKKPEEKEKLLNLVYPSQSDLWKYEKKYIIYEGRCKWLL